MIIADHLIIFSFDQIYCDDLSSEDLSLNQREIPARWLQSSISLNVHLEEGAFLFLAMENTLYIALYYIGHLKYAAFLFIKQGFFLEMEKSQNSCRDFSGNL